ncbi:G-protein coupled receptor 55-like isoform X2 [Anguilla anguilla]|uniref:G-protein coupled receptor 55-like isoform X2 n=1 Tax=Anguilla anguilla TaxID=7936 RepID=UPI0015A86FCE|nr:G-protein coupled receptor 55-like isoform X2 [Anguilla anguilla]XP_035276164.1 G-protein coupled receptor 55-like isoform X2 [Anguilla anguilla]XP_035276165.1 G-protein coupled receptor 55-like isoform X2 [Anguilla anguilla]XP_035276166.1 G-protein coupled receptor 55-like isoform X2 [Anguilla anguilla]
MTQSVKMSKCNLTDMDNMMDSLRLVIYIPIFVFGLILNTTALLVFCFQLKKWTESTIYMTNLALMDQLLLFSLPFRMYNSKWAANKRVFCSFLESLYFVSIYGSIYTITCISVDRYIGVSHPFKAKQLRSPRKALLVCATIWVLVFGATVPVYDFHPGDEGRFRCFHGFSDKGWHPALIGCLEVFGFLLPAAVLVACSARVVRVLRRSRERSPKNQACIRIIYSGLVAFLVPFTPSHLAILLQFFVRRGTITDCTLQANITVFVQLAMTLANVTCCLDALCYYFVAKEVRTSSIRRSFRQWRSTINSGSLAGMDPQNWTELSATQRIGGPEGRGQESLVCASPKTNTPTTANGRAELVRPNSTNSPSVSG